MSIDSINISIGASGFIAIITLAKFNEILSSFVAILTIFYMILSIIKLVKLIFKK